MSEAIGVLLTFTTYGTHLHGADTGSVSRDQRNWGAPIVPPNAAWLKQARRLMAEPEFTFDPQDRAVILNSIVDTCADRGWDLFCVHIRTNHVHAVLTADAPMDRVLSYLKARGTFVLKARHPDRRRFWTKHGSTRYLWNRPSMIAAVDYVMNQQGSPMASWMRQLIG